MISFHHLPILALLFLSLSSLTLSNRCHPNDEKALLQFKKDLHNPKELITWVPKTDCCKWDHLRCDDKTKRIIEISLIGGNFHLPIPAAIGDIKFLQSLTLSVCNLTGSIPPAISKLSHLDSLLIDYNDLLTGPIPSSFGKLKKLTFVRLSANNLTGSIPASLSQLPLLRVLILDQNKLTGAVPQSFGDFKEKELDFDLSDNQLSGPIPTSLGRLNWYIFRINSNRLEGDLSFMLVKNQTLQFANFSSNHFKFDFSKVEISDKLFTLDLAHNQIYGKLPPGIVNSNLKFLNVSYNSLCGRIPGGSRVMEFNATSYSNNRCLCGTPLPKCK